MTVFLCVCVTNEYNIWAKRDQAKTILDYALDNRFPSDEMVPNWSQATTSCNNVFFVHKIHFHCPTKQKALFVPGLRNKTWSHFLIWRTCEDDTTCLCTPKQLRITFMVWQRSLCNVTYTADSASANVTVAGVEREPAVSGFDVEAALARRLQHVSSCTNMHTRTYMPWHTTFTVTE